MSNTKRLDLEAQRTNDLKIPYRPTTRHDSECPTPATTKFTYLAIYFLCNVSLTIYNKAVLWKVFASSISPSPSPVPSPKLEPHPYFTTNSIQFAYPYLLTALHAFSASIGCYLILLRGTFNLTPLSHQENLTLVLFSFLFTINIAISNVSL